jgi:hypothetical protein
VKGTAAASDTSENHNLTVESNMQTSTASKGFTIMHDGANTLLLFQMTKAAAAAAC